jgi:hypothetical protein
MYTSRGEVTVTTRQNWLEAGSGQGQTDTWHTSHVRRFGRVCVCVCIEFRHHFPLPALVLTGAQGLLNHPTQIVGMHLRSRLYCVSRYTAMVNLSLAGIPLLQPFTAHCITQMSQQVQIKMLVNILSVRHDSAVRDKTGLPRANLLPLAARKEFSTAVNAT